MAVQDRKIGRHHLAFYRGWLQGMDLKVLSELYLEIGLDLRIAKSTLTWLRDSLSQAALRHGRRNEARLLRMSLRHVLGQVSEEGTASPAMPPPSLDDFREEADPDGFYKEEELIALYVEAFPQTMNVKMHRRTRLIERQLQALRWIEALVSTQPDPRDWVLAWFDQTVADRLMVAKIYNLEQLHERIRLKGFRWWTDVPRMGAKGAARIIAWLQGYEDSLGPVPLQALKPQRQQNALQLIAARAPRTAIVPMASLALPQALSGAQGANRVLHVQQISASNDMEAITAWVNTKSGSPATARSYRKEGERMLLWAIMERGKALADLNVDDCVAYRDWLSMLGRTDAQQWPYRLPQEHWIGPRNTPRTSEAWRPFDGPLSLPSVRQAIVIVNGLFQWLVNVQYYSFNPWAAVNTKPAPVDRNAPAPDLELTRVLSESQWTFLLEHVEDMPASAHKERLLFVLSFAYSTGLRLAELVEATVSRLYTRPLRGQLGQRWMLKVLGKGSKWRSVPMPAGVMERLGAYLVSRGLPSDPAQNDPSTPLIATLTDKTAMSPSMLYKALRRAFVSGAGALAAEGHTHEAAQMAKASTHWLRHTRGSHLGLAGVAPNLIQKLLGHASLDTTSIYTKSDEERLWVEMSELESAPAKAP